MKKTILLILLIAVQYAMPAQGNSSEPYIAGETVYMEFHSNYYVNLHHYLLQKGNEYRNSDETIKAEIESMPGSESAKKGMLEAVQYYAAKLVKKDLLFDRQLTRFKYALETCSGFEELEAQRILPDAVAAMKQADELYSKQVWPAQDVMNWEFIQSRLSLIRQIEKAVVARSSSYFHSGPAKKARIDITGFAGFFGAYTTNAPFISSVISSADSRHEGTQGIEIIFHEYAHSLSDSLISMQKNICRDKHLRSDSRIWHSILFYTTGKLVKEELARAGISHEMYLYKNNLNKINPFLRRTNDAIPWFWQLYMESQISMDHALSAIIDYSYGIDKKKKKSERKTETKADTGNIIYFYQNNINDLNSRQLKQKAGEKIRKQVYKKEKWFWSNFGCIMTRHSSK